MGIKKLIQNFITLISTLLLLSGCGFSSINNKYAVDNWIKEQNATAEKQREQNDKDAAMREEENKKQQEKFESEHPEIVLPPIKKLSDGGKQYQLIEAFNMINLVTRYPETQDMEQVYVKIGGYQLTLKRIYLSLQEQENDCKRAVAYTGDNINDICLKQIGSGFYNFAKMIKNPNIPNLTKNSAIGEATFGNIIAFDHAARLANMHSTLCNQQRNNGYVAMVTVAVPCGGSGDVLNISAAEKMGLL